MVEWSNGYTVNLTEALLALLAMPETRSKEDVVRQYDHEVQGGTLVKPFVGARQRRPQRRRRSRPARRACAAQTSQPINQSP